MTGLCNGSARKEDFPEAPATCAVRANVCMNCVAIRLSQRKSRCAITDCKVTNIVTNSGGFRNRRPNILSAAKRSLTTTADRLPGSSRPLLGRNSNGSIEPRSLHRPHLIDFPGWPIRRVQTKLPGRLTGQNCSIQIHQSRSVGRVANVVSFKLRHPPGQLQLGRRECSQTIE